ncbi:MAG: hypothetical protein JJU29_11805 [Verrucomicrobia bacterium]|nr:hypothetical protein [Verrucomicrobiota bacterium]MCH8513702.1 hypothetical protein [Kiritimatiellia bacterium]
MAISDPDPVFPTSHAKRMETIARFQSGVAHDLNNHLTTLLGNLMLLEMVPDPSEVEFLVDMRHAAEEASHLIRLMQTFARQETYPPHPVNVGQTLERFHDLARRLFSDACALDFILPEAPVFVEADESALEHMVLSVLADFPGELPPEWITVAITADEKQVFLDFEAASGAWALPLIARSVHELVGAYGGNLCENGTELRLTLPRTSPEVMEPEPIPEPANGIALLLAEGNPVLRAHLAQQMTAHGYQVTAVADVLECMECIASGTDFAAAVMDTRLPGGGSARLKSGTQLPTTVIWMPPTRERDPALGAEDLLLPKPFAASSLHRLLGEKR